MSKDNNSEVVKTALPVEIGRIILAKAKKAADEREEGTWSYVYYQTKDALEEGYRLEETRNAELEERNKKLINILEAHFKAGWLDSYLQGGRSSKDDVIAMQDAAWVDFKQANGI